MDLSGTAPADERGTRPGSLLRLGRMARQRAAADALAKLGEADTDGRGGPRQQARLGEPGQRVDLETPEPAVAVHAEVDAAVHVELQSAMHAHRETLNLLGLLGREVGRKDLLGA